MVFCSNIRLIVGQRCVAPFITDREGREYRTIPIFVLRAAAREEYLAEHPARPCAHDVCPYYYDISMD